MFRRYGSTLTTSTVVGDYYFENFLLKHPWVKILNSTRFPLSPYCDEGTKRAIYPPPSSDLSFLEELKGLPRHNEAQVYSTGHMLKTYSNVSQLEYVKVNFHIIYYNCVWQRYFCEHKSKTTELTFYSYSLVPAFFSVLV